MFLSAASSLSLPSLHTRSAGRTLPISGCRAVSMPGRVVVDELFCSYVLSLFDSLSTHFCAERLRATRDQFARGQAQGKVSEVWGKGKILFILFYTGWEGDVVESHLHVLFLMPHAMCGVRSFGEGRQCGTTAILGGFSFQAAANQKRQRARRGSAFAQLVSHAACVCVGVLSAMVNIYYILEALEEKRRKWEIII